MKNNSIFKVPLLAYFCISFAVMSHGEGVLDNLQLGEPKSELAHHFEDGGSDVLKGGLDEPARRLLPLEPTTWEGGSFSFSMKVDPVRQNYLTVRLWGSDVTQDILILFCEGKQVGYRHLGDIDSLFVGNGSPPLNGRFFYVTTPLPLALTFGKEQVALQVRSTGPIWGYGTTWENYQKSMTSASCSIYRFYTHTDVCFVPPADEKQGAAPTPAPVRVQPGEEVMSDLKNRVSGALNETLTSTKPLDQMHLELLAKAYEVKWTPAFHNPTVVESIIKGADEYFRQFRKDPTIAQADTHHAQVYNSDWLGLGPLGHAIELLAQPLKESLDEQIDDGAGSFVTRRNAWSEMLVASREWHMQHRREYSNQSMITDLYSYFDNRALEAIDPAQAMSEDKIRHYLYQSLGIEPWLGSDSPKGPLKPLGDNYYELTSKALTKELGFVGYYGEVLDWATSIYLATAEGQGSEAGDKQIKDQLIKIMQARSVFRYPALDNDGNRAMRAETIVGWRDEGHYPGDITYVERPTRDASALYCAAATLSPDGVGAFQEMMADNQFFATLEVQMQEKSLRSTAGLLGVPDEYDKLKAQPDCPLRLPMSPGQPDFAWADEDDGVVAIKHSDEIFYASLYWRARPAINFLARVHLINPLFDRIAVVREDVSFDASGQNYTRRDWVNEGFGNGGIKYPDELHSAETGEILPIAKYPENVAFRPGEESPYAGKGNFYQLEYGNYLIAMNCSQNKTFSVKLTDDQKQPNVADLISGQVINLAKGLEVAPHRTAILYFPDKRS